MATKTKTKAAPRTRTRMQKPVKVSVGGSDGLELIGPGSSSTYKELFEQFQTLDAKNPKKNTLEITPSEGVTATRYRDNLTQGFHKLLGKKPMRGLVSFRLTKDGRVAVIKLA